MNSALLWVPKSLRIGDMVSLSFDHTPGSSVDALPIEIFEHWKFLRVERSVKKMISNDAPSTRHVVMNGNGT